MIDSREPPKRGSGTFKAVTPLIEARNAHIELRKLLDDLEINLMAPVFGKLKDANEAWLRVKKMMQIIGEGFKDAG